MATPPTSSPQDADSEPIRATLLIESPTGSNCPVIQEAPNATGVSQTFSSGESGCRSCYSEVTTNDGPDTTPQTLLVSTEVESSCICSTISEFECAFSIESVRDGALVISVVVTDRERLTDIVSALRDIGAIVRLERLTNGTNTDDRQFLVDATAITDKQREAVELAVNQGYYDRPRQTDLEGLADCLDISRSAVSQRLNAVELILIRSLASE